MFRFRAMLLKPTPMWRAWHWDGCVIMCCRDLENLFLSCWKEDLNNHSNSKTCCESYSMKYCWYLLLGIKVAVPALPGWYWRDRCKNKWTVSDKYLLTQFSSVLLFSDCSCTGCGFFFMTYLKEISVKCLIFNIGYSKQTTQMLEEVYVFCGEWKRTSS